MKRLLALAVAAAAAAVAVAVMTTGAGGSRTVSKAATIHVIEHATTDAVTNHDKKTDSAGDVLTFANAVFDSADAKKVGSDQGYCVRTVAGKAWECIWTTFLAKGQITVEGPFYDAANSALAITGGTGAYGSARGWMDLKYHNPKGTEIDFIFHFTG